MIEMRNKKITKNCKKQISFVTSYLGNWGRTFSTINLSLVGKPSTLNKKVLTNAKHSPQKTVSVPEGRCFENGNTLSKNRNHLVEQLEPPCLTNENTGWQNLLRGKNVKGQESRVMSQESSDKSQEQELRVKRKMSRVKS